ncbi:hypothetical protein H310_01037 [Aphanomyces invadans]|uniref:WW domain-containing protein n=1 Tax=Aphanomyces invadans TaxID=157072 RepID=A0A024URI5_9STRA|nr:hypothetical protein H310_01037 [Aphanomyces invadans]ETW08457.1 hypothetical protein H310_01037 [Aphanomyces invadans]|eukprot:XP_008862262.1 hypothetical protein H310_01037 [Aphanomyces invadans]
MAGKPVKKQPPTSEPPTRKRKKGVHPLKRGRLEWGRHMTTKKQHFAATMIQRKFRAYRYHMDHLATRANVRSTMQRVKLHRIFFDREFWEGVNLRDLKRTELEDLAFRLELPVAVGKKEKMIRTIQHWIDLRMHVQDVAIQAAMRATEKKLQAQGSVYVLPALPKAEPRMIRPLSGRNIASVAAGYESEALYAIDSAKGTVWLCKTSGQSAQVGFCSTLVNQDVFELPYQSTWLANPMPMQTLRIGHIQDIQVTHSHAMALARAGEVYSWGSNAHGQLGADNAAKHHQLPVVVGAIESFVTVSIGVGAQHSMAVCNDVKGRDGVVFAWGSNAHSQLGVENQGTVFSPVEVHALRGIRVRKVACGTLHSAVVTDHGDMYTWGCNDGGRLAQPTDENIVPLPRKVTGVHAPYDKAIDIACGPWHTAALLVERLGQTSGVVFTWGNGICGQLGQGKVVHATSPHMVILPPMKRASEPLELVKQMACGMHHTAALTENGSLYTWGSHHAFSPLPHKLLSLKGSRGRIASIACGSSFTAFCILAMDEQLYEANHRHLLWHTRTTDVPKLDLTVIPPPPLRSAHNCIPRLRPRAETQAEERLKKDEADSLDGIDLHEMLHPRCRLCWRCPGFESNLNYLTMCRICKHKREHHGKRKGPMGEYEAVRKLQGKFRQRQGVHFLHQTFLERIQRVFSIRHGAFFYYNKCNRAKSWNRPRLLPPELECPIRDPDDEAIVKPPYTVDDAARVIQSLFRSRKARKLVQTILHSRYETCISKTDGRIYYRDRRTNAVRWNTPFHDVPKPVRRQKRMTEAEAVATVQRCLRGAKARKNLRRMMQKRFKALVDASSGATYYYDSKTKEVSWTKPRFFSETPVVEATKHLPKYTKHTAASTLQRLYHGRKARRNLVLLLHARFQQAWDPQTQQHYFVDTVTNSTTWSKPVLLKHVDLSPVKATPVDKHHKRKKKKAYNMTDVDAAIRLQAVLRSKITRKRAQTDLHRQYERVWDANAKAHFYHNIRTDVVTWTPPPLWNDAVYEKIEMERINEKNVAMEATMSAPVDSAVSKGITEDKVPPEAVPLTSQRRRAYTITEPEEAAKIVQRHYRRHKAQVVSIESLMLRFQKVFDPNTHRSFYYDNVTQTSTWTAPLLLQKHARKMCPSPTKYTTPDSAAVRIQGIFRLRKARQEALQLAQASYEKVYDETVQAYYYFNVKTGQSQWTKPKCFRHSDVQHVVQVDGSGNVIDSTTALP